MGRVALDDLDAFVLGVLFGSHGGKLPACADFLGPLLRRTELVIERTSGLRLGLPGGRQFHD